MSAAVAPWFFLFAGCAFYLIYHYWAQHRALLRAAQDYHGVVLTMLETKDAEIALLERKLHEAVHYD